MGSTTTHKEHMLEQIDHLDVDPWLVKQGMRPERSLGVALNSAMALVECLPAMGARIQTLIGGPPTIGPGTVATPEKEHCIRAQVDLDKGDFHSEMFKKARAFYDELIIKAIKSKATLDVFGFSLDQFGLSEMRFLVERTGGFAIIQEEFKQQVFQDSIKKYFEIGEGEDNFLKVASGASIEQIPQKPLKIKGALGSCYSSMTKSDKCSGEVVGQGSTDKWFIGGLDQNCSLTFLFDVDQKSSKDSYANNNVVIQLLTQYKHPNGSIRLRVTTITRTLIHTFNPEQIQLSIDQQAVIAVFSKLAASKSQELDSSVVIRWLDKNLIFIMKAYGKYKGEKIEANLIIPDEISIIPQFFYYLRKSWFVRTFASSIDESVYYRLIVGRENVPNVLTMIQPCITQYDLDNEQPIAVICDIESLRDNIVLLMDCYFFVGIWYGATIHSWVEEKYHEQEDYAHLKVLLDAPEEDAKAIASERINAPKIVHTYAGHGLERIFKSRLNASSDAHNETVDGGNFITDDKSLNVFMEHLIKAVVNQG